jgi:hypothetical protein
MFEFAFIKAIGGFFSKIGFKGILILLALCVVGYGEYRLYDYGKTKQLAVDAPKLKTAQDELAAYKKSYADWIVQSNKAKATLANQQQAIVNDLQAKLAAAAKVAQQKQIIYKEVTRYVSKADDAQCVLNSGFVQLYNGGYEDPDADQTAALSTGANPGAGLSETRSNIQLSQFSSVSFINNLQAVQFRNEVIAWRIWYVKQAAAFNAMTVSANAVVPVDKTTPQAKP